MPSHRALARRPIDRLWTSFLAIYTTTNAIHTGIVGRWYKADIRYPNPMAL